MYSRRRSCSSEINNILCVYVRTIHTILGFSPGCLLAHINNLTPSNVKYLGRQNTQWLTLMDYKTLHPTRTFINHWNTKDLCIMKIYCAFAVYSQMRAFLSFVTDYVCRIATQTFDYLCCHLIDPVWVLSVFKAVFNVNRNRLVLKQWWL